MDPAPKQFKPGQQCKFAPARVQTDLRGSPRDPLGSPRGSPSKSHKCWARSTFCLAPCSAFKILKKEQGGLGPLWFSRILGRVLRHTIGEASGQWNRLAVAPPPAGKMGSAPFQEIPEIPGGSAPPPWRAAPISKRQEIRRKRCFRWHRSGPAWLAGGPAAFKS